MEELRHTHKSIAFVHRCACLSPAFLQKRWWSTFFKNICQQI